MSFADRQPGRKAAVAVFICIIAANFLFLSLIAHYEPVCNDGWWHLYRLKTKVDDQPGLSYLINRIKANYMERNPRFGQTITHLNYWPYHIHEILTPTMILVLYLALFVLALGRMPRPTDLHDSYIIVMMTALCWLAIPEVGVAFFYRPIAGNYVFGACVQLLLFIPLRLWVDYSKKPLLNVGFSMLMLVAGGIAGMANEHTGPFAVVAFAMIVVFRSRRGKSRPPIWAASGWVGLVAGYLALFFAPSQSIRYEGLATKTTLTKNITARGWNGNLEIVGDFTMMLLPLLAVMGVMAWIFVANGPRNSKSTDSGNLRQRMLIIGFLAACAVGLVTTTFASPLIRVRLYIAPMLVLIIAGVMVVEIVGSPKKLATVLWIGAILVNLWYMTRIYVVYSTVHREFLERTEMLSSAETGSIVRVPLLSYTAGSRIYIGDDFTRESRRKWAAQYYGLERIDICPRPSPCSDSE